MDLFAWLNLIVAVFFVLVGYYYLVHTPERNREIAEMSRSEYRQWFYKRMHNSSFVKYAMWSLVFAICLVFMLPIFGMMFHLTFILKVVSSKYTSHLVLFNTFTVTNKMLGYYLLLIGPIGLLSALAINGFEKWERNMRSIEEIAKTDTNRK